DPVGVQNRELEDQSAAEGVPDERGAPNTRGVERLEHVVSMGGEGPGRLPVGEAVASKVRRENAEPLREALLREAPEAAPMGVDAVQANDRRRARISPLVQMKLHQREILPTRARRALRHPCEPPRARR